MINLQVKTPIEVSEYANIDLTTALIIGIMALAGVVVFLYMDLKTLNKEYKDELKSSNATLINLNSSYNQFVANMSVILESKREK